MAKSTYENLLYMYTAFAIVMDLLKQVVKERKAMQHLKFFFVLFKMFVASLYIMYALLQ